MSMMQMTWMLVVLIVVLLVLAAGAFVAVRVLGARETRGDHQDQ